MPILTILYIRNEPPQLAAKPLDVPQSAVTFIPLYVPCAGLLQLGAFVQVTLVAVFPLLQVKAGGVIAIPDIPLIGTLPQVSVAELTVNVPQLAVKLLDLPQSAVAPILYVPSAGLLQFGIFDDHAILVGCFPLLQVKVGGVIATSEIPLDIELHVSEAELTVNAPQLAVKLVATSQFAIALILLYAPGAGLLQLGAFNDHAILLGVFPLLQIKTGGVIATSEIPLTGIEPQVSAAETINMPEQEATKLVAEPQFAIALILLYVPGAGLLQSMEGSPNQFTPLAVSPLLQVKAGEVIGLVA